MTTTTPNLDAHQTIESLLARHPQAARVLLKHGMACVGCTMARFETLAEAAREYRVDLRALLNDLRAPHPHSPRTRRGES
jgi:hybrid cluster-associated redox disulfide protein